MDTLRLTIDIPNLPDDVFKRADFISAVGKPVGVLRDTLAKELETEITILHDIVSDAPVVPAVRRGRPRKDTAPKPITELSVEEMRSLVGHAA